MIIRIILTAAGRLMKKATIKMSSRYADILHLSDYQIYIQEMQKYIKSLTNTRHFIQTPE